MNKKHFLFLFIFLILVIVVATAAAFLFPPASPRYAATETTASSPSVPRRAPVIVMEPEQLSQVKQAAANVTTLPLPYSADRFDKNSWTVNWGVSSIKNGVFTFGATPSTTGGTVLLNGSDRWSNYAVQADVVWGGGKAFDIFARFSDTHNFSYCNFGAGYAGIVERINDKETTLGEKSGLAVAVQGAQVLGMRVYENKVACTVSGKDVVTGTFATGIPSAGGIGFSLWDPVPGVSHATISRLSVVALATDDIAPAPPAALAADVAQGSAPASSPTPAGDAGSDSGAGSASAPAAEPAPAAPPAPLALPYVQSNFVNDANWTGTWGNVAPTANGALAITAFPDGTGGSVFLANAEKWSNYIASAVVDWPQGRTFSLVARYIDDNNYVACLFDETDPGLVRIHLRQYRNGTVYNLAEGADADFVREGRTNIAVSLKVLDTIGTCSFNNHVVSNGGGNTYTLTPPFRGSIGFNTWDPTFGKAQIVIKKAAAE